MLKNPSPWEEASTSRGAWDKNPRLPQILEEVSQPAVQACHLGDPRRGCQFPEEACLSEPNCSPLVLTFFASRSGDAQESGGFCRYALIPRSQLVGPLSPASWSSKAIFFFCLPIHNSHGNRSPVLRNLPPNNNMLGCFWVCKDGDKIEEATVLCYF